MTSITQFAAPAVAGLLLSARPSVGDARGLHLAYAVALGLSIVVALVALSVLLVPGTLRHRPPSTTESGRAALREVLGSRSVTTAIVVGFSVLSASDLLVPSCPRTAKCMASSRGRWVSSSQPTDSPRSSPDSF